MPTRRFFETIMATILCLGIPTLAVSAFAEEEEAPEPLRTVIKAVKFADVTALPELVGVLGYDVAVDSERKLVVLHGPNATMETAIKLVDALDEPEPPWGIELLVHLVSASRDTVDGSGVPEDLEESLSEVSEIFGYRSFELVDTVFLFATTASGSARVHAPVRDGSVFEIGFERATWLYGEPKHSVRFENLRVSAPAANIQLHTNVEVPEDHKVLIGKSSLRGADRDEDLVLVIEIRLRATWSQK